MRWLGTVWSEFIALFVDDGALAIAALVWLAVAWAVLRYVPLAPVLLFLGLAAILIESVLRHARRVQGNGMHGRTGN